MRFWREALDILVSYVLSCVIAAVVCDFLSAWGSKRAQKHPAKPKHGAGRS